MEPGTGNTVKPVVILVIDDDITSVMMLEGWLQRDGYVTRGITDGEAGYRAAQEEKPDAILLDVDLGTGWGPDICRRLKASGDTSEIPVLFLSASIGVETKLECFEAGGQDYIVKPYEPHEVLARVRTHLRLVQAMRVAIEVQSARIRDLARAQQALLPPSPRQMPAARFAVYLRELDEAGGDFYDIVQVSDRVFDYIVADVSGHDVGVALVTSALKTLFAQNCTPVNSPAMILSIVNKVIPSVLQPGQFVGISWLRVNRTTSRVVIINAGQPPVLHVPKDGEVVKVDVSGDIIGAFDSVRFEERDLAVKPGDRFLLYSDGIIEREGKTPEARENGIEKLVASCSDTVPETVDAFVKIVSDEFGRPDGAEDDIVILGVEI